MDHAAKNSRHSLRVAVLAVLVAVGGMGCREKNANVTSADSQSQTTAKPVSAEKTPTEATPAAAIDGAKAFEHVKQQVAFGPRPAGSAALAEARKYIVKELKSYGLTVREDKFTADTPVGKVEMTNVVGVLPGASTDVLVIGSHYDTKRLKDFVGANDGGSSTGALLEIARVLALQAKEKPFELTIEFAFFDGEEAVIEWTDEDSTYGSRHFVARHEKAGTLQTVRAMVLLDMIGDRDLTIPREMNSTRPLTEIIWQTAGALGYAKNFPSRGTYIEDDHIPFLKAGIPAVDLIDFTYGTEAEHFGPGGPNNAYWHAATDTLDKISADSLKIVGDVVVAATPKIMKVVSR